MSPRKPPAVMAKAKVLEACCCGGYEKMAVAFGTGWLGGIWEDGLLGVFGIEVAVEAFGSRDSFDETAEGSVDCSTTLLLGGGDDSIVVNVARESIGF